MLKSLSGPNVSLFPLLGRKLLAGDNPFEKSNKKNNSTDDFTIMKDTSKRIPRRLIPVYSVLIGLPSKANHVYLKYDKRIVCTALIPQSGREVVSRLVLVSVMCEALFTLENCAP